MRFVSPIASNEAAEEVDVRMQRFMRELLPLLPDYVPF